MLRRYAKNMPPYISDLHPLIKFLLAVTTIVTPAMIVIKLYLEIRIFKIKLNDSINTIRTNIDQSPKVIDVNIKSKTKSVRFDVAVFLSFCVFMIVGFLIYGFEIGWFLFALGSTLLFILVGFYKWLQNLTESIKSLLDITKSQIAITKKMHNKSQ